MNVHDLVRLGAPPGEAAHRGVDFVTRFLLGGGDKTRLREEVEAVIREPGAFVRDPLRRDFAKALLAAPPSQTATRDPVPYRRWGEGLEPEVLQQMERACQLPIAVAGALMPDAHVGYGLPIGGVLATDNAVVPYAVGVDIACRMKMTVLDLPVRDLERKAERLKKAIEAETRFGVGST
ncbi:MAG TPA: RtcB family protein, partial [Thermoanaerobaculia bacterium]|nr:RtcB family protein [Thermoanaerobaculia bacterium]